jgi:MFS family permease
MTGRRFALRQTLLIIGLMLATALFVSGLSHLKFGKVLRETQTETLEIAGRAFASTVEFALDLGLRVEDIAALKPQAQDLAANEPAVSRIVFVDTAGHVRFDTRQDDLQNATAPSEDKRRATRVGARLETSPLREFPVINDFGAPAGALRLWREDALVKDVLSTLMASVLRAVALSLALACPLVFAATTLIIRLERRAQVGSASLDVHATRLRRRLAALAGCAVASLALYVSMVVFDAFEREVRPIMEGESAAIARAIAPPLSRTVENGFSLADAPDLDAFLDENLKLYPQVTAIALRDVSGWARLRGRQGETEAELRALADAGFETILPLGVAPGVAAWLHVITSPQAVSVATSDARWDIVVLILVALLIVFEIFRFVFARQSLRPAGEAAFAPAHETSNTTPLTARFALFLFVMSDQFSVSFIVIHAREIAGPGAATFLYALPIIAFIGAIALMGAYTARLIEAAGARRALMIGCLIAASGFLLAFATSHVWLLATARFINGLGYAVATLALQSFMSTGRDEREIKSNLASFTSAIMIGCVCGAATGGVLAERIGHHLVFLAAAALSLAPIIVMHFAPVAERARVRAPAAPVPLGEALRLREFLAVLCLVAIPAKIVLSAFVFYLAPLFLKDLGLSQAGIARNVMLYALCMVPAITLGDWLMRRNVRSELILLSAAFGTILALLAAPYHAAIALAAIGVAQGVASVPMLGKIPAIAQGDRNLQTALFALLRSGERIGGVIGPALAAASLAALEPAYAVLPLAGLTLVLAALLTAHIRSTGKRIA